MREVCLVPTYQREDLLYCCLEAIRAAEPNISLQVFPDRGTIYSVAVTCGRFGATIHRVPDHHYHGNSYNVMEALKWAYHQNADRVFIVEDDTIVDPDFFAWCRNALTARSWAEPFAACGWQYSPNAPKEDGPDLLIPWYLSVAACIPRKSLFHIVQHANVDYYSDMKGYLDRVYPASHRRGTKHYEQDGLVLRTAEALGQRCIWPRRPRAVHCGWYGYHMDKGKPLRGTLEERIQVIKLLLHDSGALNQLMATGRLPSTRKCESCCKLLLAADQESRVLCSECFHRGRPGLAVASGSLYYLKPL